MPVMGTSRDYHHPFEPYAIQKQFMDAVYDVCEHGRIGILESPTGTGKSLSLICGALTWLREFKGRQFEGARSTSHEDDEDVPDWMVQHERQQKRREFLGRRRDREIKLAKIRAREERAKQRFEQSEPPAKRQKTSAPASTLDEDSFALDDYESDEDRSKPRDASDLAELGLSAETRALLEKYGGAFASQTKDDLEQEDEMKIFFCSRTHSQLSQFVNELRRVKMPPAVADDDSENQDAPLEEFKHISLGSRKNLCINDSVKRLAVPTAINERCLELQQSGTSAEARCKFLPSKDTEVLVNDFRDYALAKIRDIEDFGKLGQKLGVCPYYATRAAVKPAEIVTLPYPLLLQRAARGALGLSLKNHVVIIDEAHNLMDAIANVYSVSVSLVHLQQARAQLGVYLQKFRNKLKGKNRVYVTQLVRLLDSLMGFLSLKTESRAAKEGIIQVDDLMSGKGADQINLYKLMHYLQESKLARKVDGYQAFTEETAAHVDKTADKASRKSRSLPVLTHVQSFLLALTNPAPEGRFFYSKEDTAGSKLTLKYLLLDPTEHFKDIVTEARAVVLAGGTMSPMSDYTLNLFHYLPPDRLQTLSCGHVIPKTQLMARGISNGPDGTVFDFTFEKRNSSTVIENLGAAIDRMATCIPDGMVVFFPSYAYLDQCAAHWKQSKVPSGQTRWHRLAQRKSIFTEPSSSSKHADSAQAGAASRTNAVDATLAAYIEQVQTGKGALLLAVIGGSLSEGINFSDKLGRGIVVVGLPFPNANSPEWKAKTEFLQKRAAVVADSTIRQGGAAKEYYENACMRAVNQSIGRAIRHRNDFAAIMLIDQRYERANIKAKLPGWIQDSYEAGRHVDSVETELDGFFAANC